MGPVVLADVPRDARLAEEVHFGPLLALFAVDGFQDALELDAIAPIEVGGAFGYGEGMARLADDEIQQIAPALGAAIGRN